MLTDQRPQLIDAAEILRRGGLVAIPTETVYGLAADATNDHAVARIFEAKGRPQFNPLIAHVTDVDMAMRYVDLSDEALVLAQAFWPGPLTIVARRRADCAVSLLASAGLETLGVRCPGHDLARALIAEMDSPLAAPSANRSGSVSPTRPEHVKASLNGRVDFILDGGDCKVGLESTIVKIEEGAIIVLRPGGISREDLSVVSKLPVKVTTPGAAIEAPGMMKSHYAPSVRVRLNALEARDGEIFLGFHDKAAERGLNLSPKGDLREAAANLFAYFHHLDAECQNKNIHTIAVAPIPDTGIGLAINDRLRRAAHQDR